MDFEISAVDINSHVGHVNYCFDKNGNVQFTIQFDI